MGPPERRRRPDLEARLLGIEQRSPEEEAEAERQAREQLDLERAFMADLMARPVFRRWLFGKLQEWNTFHRTFGATVTGFPDERATEYHLGVKAAGWDLWCYFDDLAPELASQMRREGLSVRV